MRVSLGVLFVSFVLLSSAVAQTTWTVCASGGPGVQFTTLAAAVAAAADGDVVVCLPPQFGEALTGFTTNKGITVLGSGGEAAIPLFADSASPIVVQGLPAGRTFRMVGFQFVRDGQLRIDVQSCQGHVHLENLRARDVDFFFPTTPGVVVANSPSVVLRDVAAFGVPALRVDGSRVTVERCGLGVPINGVRGGRGLVATNAEVDLVECVVDTGSAASGPGLYVPAIEATQSVVRIAGDSASRIAAGTGAAPGGIPIVANGGSVDVDPDVVLLAGSSQPFFAGSAIFTVGQQSATWSSTALPGQVLDIRTSAPSGSVVFQAVGVASPWTPTPFGALGIDLAQPHQFFGVAIPDASGHVAYAIAVPSGLPPGSAFATQAAVAVGGSLLLSVPSAFVVL